MHREERLSLVQPPGIFLRALGGGGGGREGACGLSVGQLAVVAEVEAGHDPHAEGLNESATPLAPRQVGVELVAQRAFSERPERKELQRPRQPSHL